MASNYDYDEQELQEYYEQCEDNLARLKEVENSWGNNIYIYIYIENPNNRMSAYSKRSSSLILLVNFI